MVVRLRVSLLLVLLSSLAAEEERHRLVAGDMEVEVVVNDERLEPEFGPRFASTARVVSVVRGGLSFVQPAGLPDEFSPDGEGTTGFSGPAGETGFLKVGVGLLLRDTEAPADYDAFWRYPVAQRALAVVTERTAASLAVEATHARVAGVVLTLRQHFTVSDDGLLTIAYELRNAGETAWQGRHFNHHFLGFDGRPADGRYRLRPVGVPPVSPRVRRGVETGAGEWRLTRWPTAARAAIAVFDRGSAPVPADEVGGFDLSHEAGGSVSMRSSLPLTTFTLWADHRSVSPELFVLLRVAPGETTRWSSAYRFEP